MNRFLEYFNFAGVAVLGVLLATQWQVNSRLLDNVHQLQNIKAEQAQTISNQQATLRQNAADLQDLRTRISMAETELQKDILELNRVNAENRHLKAAIVQWKQGVEARDAAIKKAIGVINQVAAERNAAIQKFNDLADKYNKLVKEFEDDQANR